MENLRAAFLYTKHKAYFFVKGNYTESGENKKYDKYVRYNTLCGMADPGYPRDFKRDPWDGIPSETVDTVIRWPNGKLYFFSGKQYYRYTPGKGQDSGYPKNIAQYWGGMEHWGFKNGSNPCKFDAVILKNNQKKAYFFKGNEYVRYDIKAHKIDDNYPKKISDNWIGVPDNIDSAMNFYTKDMTSSKLNNKAYFFKGSQYYRYSFTTNKVDNGYPKPITKWPGLPRKNWPENIAKKAVATFADSDKSPKWKSPDMPAKEVIIKQLEARIKFPWKVSQGASPLCGPAAIIFELYYRDPVFAVKIVQSLYENEYFLDRNKNKNKVSSKLSKSKAMKNMEFVDWMLLASLRDVENKYLSMATTHSGTVLGAAIGGVAGPTGVLAGAAVGSSSDTLTQLAGITWYPAMKGWCRDILGFKYVESDMTGYLTAGLNGEYSALKKVAEHRGKKKGVGFLLINSDLINKDKVLGIDIIPDHWVSYFDGYYLDGGVWYYWDDERVKFSCYSWGGKHKVNANGNDFEDGFFGVVYASNIK